MLRVLCLDCIRLVIGDPRFFVQVMDMFHLGEGPLGLDLWGAAIGFRINQVTHCGWCLPRRIPGSVGEEDSESETETITPGKAAIFYAFRTVPLFILERDPPGVMRDMRYYSLERAG